MQQSMEKNVEKQLIIRTFEPNLDKLKQTARQLAHMQDISLNLYGQAGEVLIVVTARAYAQAAATELTESVAEQFELSLGQSVYGRGKGSLAYFTAGELMEHEANIAAADADTGALLAEEFSHTKRGPAVFDFGESTYQDERFLHKVQAAEERYADEGDLAQTVAARAAAAAKYGHTDFGVAVTGLGSGEFVYLAVAHQKYVYLRRLRDSETAGKSAALILLDLIRRLIKKLPVGSARMFRANSDFLWNEPLKKGASSPYLVPIVILTVLIIALAIACWYFLTHFTFDDADAGSALPVGSVSNALSVPPEAQAPEAASSVPAASTPAAESTPAADSTLTAESTPAAGSTAQTGETTGNTVHPFG